MFLSGIWQVYVLVASTIYVVSFIIQTHKCTTYIVSTIYYICKHSSLQQKWVKVKVQWSRYRPGVAQRLGRGIALLFHDRSTRRGWLVSSTPRPHFTPGKDPEPIVQEAGWDPGPVCTGRKSCPHWDSIPDHPACSSVAIPTELPSPLTEMSTTIIS